jgi:hypothetical protein
MRKQKNQKAYINMTMKVRQSDGSELLFEQATIATFNAPGDAYIASKALNEAAASTGKAGCNIYTYAVAATKIQPYSYLNN